MFFWLMASLCGLHVCTIQTPLGKKLLQQELNVLFELCDTNWILDGDFNITRWSQERSRYELDALASKV